MNAMSSAFNFLMEAEEMDEQQMQEVLTRGTFRPSSTTTSTTTTTTATMDSAVLDRTANQNKRASMMSPSQQLQFTQMQAECGRLREQLALSQAQLAKSLVVLEEMRSGEVKNTLKRQSKGGGIFQKRDSGNFEAQPTKGRGGGVGPSATPSDEAEQIVSTFVLQTTKQLEIERNRAAALDDELCKLKEATGTKLEERLNEMARRMAKANATNEERYRNTQVEMEGLKGQVVAAKKVFDRKLQDAELKHEERCKQYEERIAQLMADQQIMNESVEKARAAEEKSARILEQALRLKHEVGLLQAELETIRSRTLNLVTPDRVEELESKVASLESIIAQKNEVNKKCADAIQMLRDKMQQAEAELIAKKEENTSLHRQLTALAQTAAAAATLGESPNMKLGSGGGAKAESPSIPLDKLRRSTIDTNGPVAPRGRSSTLLRVSSNDNDTALTSSDDILSMVAGGAAASAGSPPPFPASIAWRDWVTEDYVYDDWSKVASKFYSECEWIALCPKGHNVEQGKENMPGVGDKRCIVFVEPLERVQYYQLNLMRRPHVHLLGVSLEGDHLILSVETASEENRGAPLRALLHTRSRTLRLVVNMEPDVRLRSNILNLFDYLDERYPGCNFKRVDDPIAHEHVCVKVKEFEDMHLDLNRRVGILYWKAGQTENEAFGNQMSPDLDEFLQFFGRRIRLKGWEKFRGGLNVTNDETGETSVYTEYKEFCFMAHVSSLLPYNPNDEQKLDRKRHIGNDLVVIIFWEGSGMWDASMLVTQMCHVFIVVQKVDGHVTGVPRYRIAVVCRSGVAPFPPYLPAPAEFNADESLREWLFLKIINGERATFASKVFVSKTTLARKILLDKISKETMTELADPASLSAPWVASGFAVRAPIFRCRAVAPASGGDPHLLTYKKGEEVTLFCKMSGDWWNGAIGSRRGDFPSKTVHILQPKEKRKGWGKQKDSKQNDKGESLAVVPEAATTKKGGPGPVGGGTAGGGGGVGSRLDQSEREAGMTTPQYSHEVGVVVLSGINLPVAKANNGDLYLKLSLMSVGGQAPGSAVESDTVLSTPTPEWNFESVFKFSEPLWEVLRLEVWSHQSNKGSDNFLGSAEVSCAELIRAADPVRTMDIVLDSGLSEDFVSGSLRIGVRSVRVLQEAVQ